MVPGTKVCQNLRTWRAYVNSSIKQHHSKHLNTREVPYSIYSTVQDPAYRLFKQQAETVEHVIIGCLKLAGTDNTERNNNVVPIVYKAIYV